MKSSLEIGTLKYRILLQQKQADPIRPDAFPTRWVISLDRTNDRVCKILFSDQIVLQFLEFAHSRNDGLLA